MKTMAHEVKAEGWSGTVTLKVPNYKERLLIIKEMGIAKPDADQVDSAIKMIEKVKEHVVELKLSYFDQEFSSLEDLEYIKAGQDVFNEIGQVLMHGIDLGKS
jgi:hypothetical protein